MKTIDTTPEVWVSPSGNNKANGTQTEPVKTLPHALALMRAKRRAAGMTVGGRIVLTGGKHTLTRPLVLTHRDARADKVRQLDRDRSVLKPLEICSAPGERAVVSGGRRITGWQKTKVNGVNAWVASLPAVRNGSWNFTQLWVNDKRAQRPRLPETDTYRIAQRYEEPTDNGRPWKSAVFRAENRFGYAPGEMRAFRNLSDIDFVALHFWIESRIPLVSIDEQKRIASLEFPTRMILMDSHSGALAPYYLDNVFEALKRPGQWYLDRPAGKLYYIPRAGDVFGESEVIAPVADHLVRLEGKAECPAAHILLRNLTFAHTEHVPSPASRHATPQAACHVTGAIRMIHAQHCVLDHCTVEHVGSYGVEITGDSRDCDVRHCSVHDTAGGGVKVFHRHTDTDKAGVEKHREGGPWHHPKRITISDCHIYDGGHRWRQAVGVLIGNCMGIELSHCHIHDFDYSGVSVGWTWGYKESNTYGNVIEWNHIHDIGRGTLSDMGGIYTLGQQQGTRLRYNLIHDVDSRGYGGWGIYPDEGSSDILIEFNVVYNTKCASVHQHYGRDNVVRNNVLAFSREEGMAKLSRWETHNGFTFERNIILTDGVQITPRPNELDGRPMPCAFDHNLYWDINGKRLSFGGQSWSAWRKSGQDVHSVNADPMFVNPAKRNFKLKANSPAAKIGFIPFDLMEVGPR